MKYYVVALFDSPSYEKMNPIQKKISKKLRGNRNSPAAHIVLNIVDNANMDKLDSIIQKTLKPYKRFKVQVCNDISISDTLKRITLKIGNFGYIKKIERSLNETLELSGINFQSLPDDDLAISIANISINKDRKYDTESVTLDQFLKDSSDMTLKISKFEVWKQTNNKKDLCVKSYPLKLF